MTGNSKECRGIFIMVALVAMLVMVVNAGTLSATVTVENLTQLTTISVKDTNPAWSPTGDEIVFWRNADIHDFRPFRKNLI